MPNLYGGSIELPSIDPSKKLKGPGLYLFYADWCPHCNDPSFVKTWNSVAKGTTKTVKALNCANDANAQSCSALGVQGFPTIMIADASGNLTKFEGPRDIDTLLGALSSQSGGGHRRKSRSKRRTNRISRRTRSKSRRTRSKSRRTRSKSRSKSRRTRRTRRTRRKR